MRVDGLCRVCKRRGVARPRRISAGSPTSGMCRRPLAFSISPLSAMCSVDASSAGRCATRATRPSCSMRFTWRPHNAAQRRSFITPIKAINPIRRVCLRPALSHTRRSSVDGVTRRCVRQRHGGKLLLNARMRVSHRASLHRAHRRPPRLAPLHRRLVEPASSPRRPKPTLPTGV